MVAQAIAPTVKKRRFDRRARREARAFYLFISPWIIGFILCNRSGRARVYAASGSGAMSIVGGAWGSNDGGAAPVTTAAQASVR